MNVPHDTLFQNYINGVAPPNRRIARAPDKKSFKQHCSWTTDPNLKKITELFLKIPSNKIVQMVTLYWTKGLPDIQIRNTFERQFLLNHRSKFKIILQNCSSWYLLPKLHKCWTKGLPELQIRNIFKQLLLLNHWPKFKIISQNCSSNYPLTKLYKWLHYIEQKGCQISR